MGGGITFENIKPCHLRQMYIRNEIRNSLGYNKDDILLISVGELSERKNHQVVIKALSKLNYCKLRYIIVGDGVLKSKLEKMAAKYNLEDAVRFVGYRNDIPDLLLASNVFVFPSLQEGLPVALMEAMSEGLLCVVSNIRGNIDLINNSQFLFKPTDYLKLRNILKKIVSGPGVVYEKHNYRIIKKFSTDNVNRLMSDIYKNI